MWGTWKRTSQCLWIITSWALLLKHDGCVASSLFSRRVSAPLDLSSCRPFYTPYILDNVFLYCRMMAWRNSSTFCSNLPAEDHLIIAKDGCSLQWDVTNISINQCTKEIALSPHPSPVTESHYVVQLKVPTCSCILCSGSSSWWQGLTFKGHLTKWVF